MTPTPVRLFQRQTAPHSNTLQPDFVKQRYGAGAYAFVLQAPVPLSLCPLGERAGLRAAGGRASCLEFSREKVIKSAHNGGVTWLDLDCVEERYLLAGAADGSVAAYDVQACLQQTCVQIAEQAALAHAWAHSAARLPPLRQLTESLVSSVYTGHTVQHECTASLACAALSPPHIARCVPAQG